LIPQIIPDILLTLLPFLIIGSGLFSKRGSSVPFHIAWASLVAILGMYNIISPSTDFYLSNWRIDSFGVLLRQVLVLSALFAIWLGKEYFDRGGDGKAPLTNMAEFMGSIVFVTIGGVIVVSACELVTLFIGLELATIPMYFLVAWNRRDAGGAEAATKYILMGSVATAVELFGFGYLYGFAGSMQLQDIALKIATDPNNLLLWIAVLFLITSLGFKLTLFPFHTWAPDVYEGAPTPVTAFLSVSSKAAGIAFLTVLVYGPFAPIHERIVPFLALLAAVTLFAGNLGALKQSRLRRFMAYSSIAQAGYILIALCGAAHVGKTALVFYLYVYTFTNYLAFFIIGIIGEKRPESFTSLHGLAKQNPTLAVLFTLAMFSLAGIPPLAGFMGKFMLFSSAASKAQYLLVAFAAINSVVALYYYIQLIKSAWVDEPVVPPAALTIGLRQKLVLALLSLAVLLMGTLSMINGNIHQILMF
jgi:NADH-quinone oxidoreductase subunit N